METRSIGPEAARELLANMRPTQNGPPLRAEGVRRFARQMSAGEWRPGSVLILTRNGMLSNGQHRMHAVIESGTVQSFLIRVRG